MATVRDVVETVMALDKRQYDQGLREAASSFDQFVSRTAAAQRRLRGREKLLAGMDPADAAGLTRITDRLDAARSASESFGQGARIAGVGAAAMAAGLGAAVSAADRLARARTAFDTLFGEQGGEMLQAAQEFDKASPFDFEASVQGVQRLRAMGLEAEAIIPTMRAAGDAVATMGGDTEQFNGVLRAIGQIQTKGRVSAEELNQLAERGINAYAILAEKLGLTQEEIRRIGDRGIEASTALPALVEGLEEQFGGGMAKAMNTLQGQLSSLRSELFKLGAALGEPVLKPAIGLVRAVTGLVEGFNKLPPPVKAATGFILAMATGALAALAVALKAAEFATGIYIKSLVLEAALHDNAARAAIRHATALKGVAGASGAAALGSGATAVGAGAGTAARAAGAAGTAVTLGGVASGIAAGALVIGGALMQPELANLAKGGLKALGVPEDIANTAAKFNYPVAALGDVIGGMFGGDQAKGPGTAGGGASASARADTSIYEKSYQVLQAILNELKTRGEGAISTSVIPGAVQAQVAAGVSRLFR